MKFMTVLAVGLLPMTALAAPAADANPNAAAAPIAEPVEVATSPVDAGRLFKRSNVYCKIISKDGPVNCRDGPGTSSKVVHVLQVGNGYYFKCYKNGTSYQGNK